MSWHNMVNTHYIQLCLRTLDIWRLLLLRVSGTYLGPTVVIYHCSSHTWHAPRFTILPTWWWPSLVPWGTGTDTSFPKVKERCGVITTGRWMLQSRIYTHMREQMLKLFDQSSRVAGARLSSSLCWDLHQRIREGGTHRQPPSSESHCCICCLDVWNTDIFSWGRDWMERKMFYI